MSPSPRKALERYQRNDSRDGTIPSRLTMWTCGVSVVKEDPVRQRRKPLLAMKSQRNDTVAKDRHWNDTNAQIAGRNDTVKHDVDVRGKRP
jgi:hypothetical protein